MDELTMLIVLALFLVFGVPIMLIVAGLTQLRRRRKTAKILLILGTAWLIVGGGICATLLAA